MQMVYRIDGNSGDRLTLTCLMNDRQYEFLRADEWMSAEEFKQHYRVGALLASEDNVARACMAARETQR